MTVYRRERRFDKGMREKIIPRENTDRNRAQPALCRPAQTTAA
jgi:hypothetical protein